MPPRQLPGPLSTDERKRKTWSVNGGMNRGTMSSWNYLQNSEGSRVHEDLATTIMSSATMPRMEYLEVLYYGEGAINKLSAAKHKTHTTYALITRMGCAHNTHGRRVCEYLSTLHATEVNFLSSVMTLHHFW